ncbi:MAG TPA: anti-sigma factor [Acidimicrobiales bacterium]|nr:anti-sigma factor [Acidimicrobiales bacterium]
MTGHDPADPAVERLVDTPAVWAEVPAGLRERVLADALRAGDGTNATRTAPWPSPRGGHPTLRRWQRPVLRAAAVAVLSGLMVAGGLQLGGGTDPGGVEVALSGTGEVPGATATAELRDEPSGVSLVLEVDGLPPAPEGAFYEVWLVGPAGKVSAGTFHLRARQDHIQLWLGVEPDGYDAITVTRQPTAGGTTAEGVAVLRGDLRDR